MFKQGRTTGPTHGERHGTTAVTRVYQCRMMQSLEQVVLPDVQGGHFAGLGDSGALVYGSQGEVSGMIWGVATSSAEDQDSVSAQRTTVALDRAVFVTPTEALLLDIQAKCDRELGEGKVRVSVIPVNG